RLDARVGDETVLQLEGVERVVVEADNESGQDVDPVLVNAADGREDVFVQILRLQRFLQAARVGRLDADEHPAEVGLAEQLQQFLVLREVERRFSAEAERVLVSLLILLQVAQQLLAQRQMADQIVVDEEHAAYALCAQ